MIVRVLAGACLLALLSACGQRGPLFLPDEAPVEVRQTRSQTPAAEPAKPAEPAAQDASEPESTEVPPQAEPAPKPDEPKEKEKTGADAGKLR
ncbi:MAG: LPS translocon maturation chaperone LptM [Steroidobacteraceae bacterium]